MTEIERNLKALHVQMTDACNSAGRDPASVQLLAVSKTRNLEEIKLAIEAGQGHFGENYLQEAVPKVTAETRPVWHFIGAIQSNKTREIANHFDWVHSVGSARVARRLSEQRGAERAPIKVMLQINLSGEQSKSGMTPEQAEQTLDIARGYSGIKLCGLMTLPEATRDEALQRQRFRDLRVLRDRWAELFNLEDFSELSMGMTADYQVAISEGATWIRVGTAIFGERT